MKNKLKLYRVIIVLLSISLIFIGIAFAKDFVVAAGTNHIIGIDSKTEIEPFSVLMIGTDADRSEDGSEGARADVLMVATVNPENSRGNMEVDVVSIPRDTVAYVTCGDYYGKINSAYSYGLNLNGEQQEAIDCTVDTVENLLNIPIDYYMDVSFDGVIAMIDAIGGIEIDVPYAFCEQDSEGNGYSGDPYACPEGSIFIDEGVQTLNGEEALAYARQRHASSTYERDMRQQEVIAATLHKILSDPTAYLVPALEVYQEYVVSNIDINTMTEFANIAVTAVNNTMGGLSSSTPVIVDVITSPYANQTSIESALSAFSGLNLENVKSKPISEVYETTAEYEQYSEVKQIYISKKATPVPSSPTKVDDAGNPVPVEPFEIEFQSMSMLATEFYADGSYSYADPITLYYTSNELRSCLELEEQMPVFDFEAASAAFGYDMTANVWGYETY